MCFPWLNYLVFSKAVSGQRMEVDGYAEPQATCDIRLIGPRGCVAIERDIVPLLVLLGTVHFFFFLLWLISKHTQNV